MNVLDLLAPPACILCGEMGYDGLCPACRKTADALFDPHPFLCNGGNGFADGMYALFHYDSAFFRFLILDFKANGYRDSRAIFRSYLTRAVERREFFRDFDRVTFCPRTRSARGARGFDQARLLAEDAAAVTGVPMEKLLSRSGFARAQHRLTAEKRRENVKNTFRAEQNLPGANILLVDDVVTTGATAGEAARILKRAGAHHVFVLCLAH